MKRHWRRGVLLGVSLALLVAGGVALAQGLVVTVDKECVDCWSGEGDPKGDQYILVITGGGWDTGYDHCRRLTVNGEAYAPAVCDDQYPPTDPYSWTDWFPCEWSENDPVPALALAGEASVAKAAPGPLGEWKYRMWQEIPGSPDPSAEVSFLVAEDCAAAMFVPEPGSIMLLGSGLVGLAGYAALRLRSGQALRWNTRE